VRCSLKNLKLLLLETVRAPATASDCQVDGGHIPLKQRDKRSFEALSGVVYRPSAEMTNIIVRLAELGLSAEDDHLATMNVSTQCGAEAGMKPDTVALADGACNCWSVILSLPSLPTTALHLGWFHIAKFQRC